MPEEDRALSPKPSLRPTPAETPKAKPTRLALALLLAALPVCVPLVETRADSAPTEPGPAGATGSLDRGADPTLNRHYGDADVDRWTRIFESPGREVFDQRDSILRSAKVRPGMRVADIGAGTGLFTFLFAQAVGPSGRVYAVDTSPSFVAGIEGRARAHRIRNVVPVLNSQETTGLAPQSVDLVFLCDTYHHFEDPRAMLNSIRSALLPSGILMTIDFRRTRVSGPWVLDHVRAGRDQVVAEIEAAGFRLVEEPEILKRNYVLRFEKVGEGPHPPKTTPVPKQPSN